MRTSPSFCAALVLCALLGPGCAYHRLDNRPRVAAWLVRGETVRIGSFENHSPRLGAEEVFRKALENRIMAAAPWKLVPPTAASRWVLRATLEHYEVRALGLSLGSGGNTASAGSASRLEVSVTASVQLLDGVTGDVIISRPQLTFSNQYRVDQNFASFDNQELRVLGTLADDFAESFLTQLLEGGD
ncbi:MAG: LPS assembly lipoprotein LptE [Holophaga sp.]|nr:LPS assembly lipoprotein LptE [Holophaga sp.]